MGKRVGFWFYTGDWMKDPELRFCSIFARGVLVDLLCLMFESSRQGELARPDGTPRSDTEIIDSISGGTREQKLNALRELETSGVLKRNKETGVLYSSRLLEIAKRSQEMSAHGSRGARKTNLKKQINAQIDSASDAALGSASGSASELKNSRPQGRPNGGVTVSDSDSDSDTDSFIPSKNENLSKSSSERTARNNFPFCTEKADVLDKPLQEAFRRWLEFRFAITGQNIPEVQQDILVMDLMRRGTEKGVADIDFSIRVTAKNILNSDHDLQKQAGAGQAKEVKPYGQSVKEKVGI